MKSTRESALEIINSPDDYSFEYILPILTKLDNIYFNETDEEPFVSDAEYDVIKMIGQRKAPNHKYFTGIGSEVRGGKIKLPFPLGSLDQIEIGGIQKWVDSNNLDGEGMILTEKMDGASCLVLYDSEGFFQIAYSRGDGINGADWSRHIRYLLTVPIAAIPNSAIRGEVIISTVAFEYLKTRVFKNNGEPYKNPRNMVSGLMNSKVLPDIALPFITFFAYEIINSDLAKMNMLNELLDHMFLVPFAEMHFHISDEILTEFLNKRRDECEYEIDGVVVDVNPAEVRKAMVRDRSSLNPCYTIKYKVADESNYAVAKVIDVEINPSMHSILKPRVHFNPINIQGVTIQYATGFNAKFIYDNKIGPGAEIAITRSGDVIPYILKTVKPCHFDDVDNWLDWFDRKFSEFGEWEWNETYVDAVLANSDDSPQVKVKRMVHFFSSIDAPYLKEGSIRKLYNAGYVTEESIIRAHGYSLVEILGKNGTKVYDGLVKVLHGIPEWKLMGSSHFFGHGIGRRKFKKLVDAIGVAEVCYGKPEDYVKVDGFDIKTATKIYEGMTKYLRWVGELHVGGYVSFEYPEEVESNDSKPFADEKIVFTGFRDKELQSQVEKLGGTIQSGISGKTTMVVAANPNSNSGKMKKARDMGINIKAREELKSLIEGL